MLLTLLLEGAYLALVWKTGDRAHLGMSLLFIAATLMLMTERPPAASTTPIIWSRLVGLVLMAGMLAAVVWLWGAGLKTTEQHPLRLIPLLSLLGALFFLGGWGWVLHHRQELAILTFLGVPHLLMWWAGIPDILARWDAALAGFLLWYTGNYVEVRGDAVGLEGGAIRVTAECAGSDIITYLLGIALIALILFPLRQPRYGLVLGLAVLIGFLTNVVRVALLAVLNTVPDKEAFNYWHTSEGSQVFGVIALGLFAGWYWLMGRFVDPSRSAAGSLPLRGEGQGQN